MSSSDPLSIGSNNRTGPHVCIGTPGQDTKNPRYDSSHKRIQIGDDNIVRKNTAIQKPLNTELTQIGSRNYFMHCGKIRAIVEEFDALHARSGRAKY